MNIRDSVKQWLRMCGHAFSSTVHERLDDIELQVRSAKLVETQTALLQASVHMIENLHALAGRTVVEMDAAHVSPEAAMAAFLYSHVPHRAAIEIASNKIGSNESASTEAGDGNRRTDIALVEAGYEVYRLSVGRAGENAISQRNGQASATTAASITTAGIGTSGAKPSVSGTGMRVEPAIPGAIGLMSVGGDTVAVLNEIGDFGASVIAADLEPSFAELVPEMRRREYHWHVALYRSASRDGASYFANYPRAVPDAAGSVFFFRDYRIFAEAQAWCAATLPRTYFKPPQD